MNTKTKLSPLAETLGRAELSTARAILKEARKLLTKVGWTKGYFRALDEKGQVSGYCAMGAIGYAGEAVQRRRRCCSINTYSATSLLGEVVGTNRSVISYNDDPKTTKRQVIAKFDKAIRAAGGTK